MSKQVKHQLRLLFKFIIFQKDLGGGGALKNDQANKKNILEKKVRNKRINKNKKESKRPLSSVSG